MNKLIPIEIESNINENFKKNYLNNIAYVELKKGHDIILNISLNDEELEIYNTHPLLVSYDRYFTMIEKTGIVKNIEDLNSTDVYRIVLKFKLYNTTRFRITIFEQILCIIPNKNLAQIFTQCGLYLTDKFCKIEKRTFVKTILDKLEIKNDIPHDEALEMIASNQDPIITKEEIYENFDLAN